MLFNSYIFIFVFLPIVMLGFYLIGQYSHAGSTLWLTTASLFFYSWWDFHYLGILLASIIFNYAAGFLIFQRNIFQLNLNLNLNLSSRLKNRISSKISPKNFLIIAIGINLAFLAYFKYANFFIENVNQITNSHVNLAAIILPLGISFFTFTQIAFLVDTFQGKVKEFNFIHYTLFVTYFPHLIAGPVLHHAEMMPQFSRRSVSHINWDNIAIGLSIFIFGLAKKVLLADSMADFSTPVFEAVKAGNTPLLFESWLGALAYTLQLYFDFSAYSDMAMGLSLMLNVRLPLNFNSPYKATSIIEFWRCWHMTLSRFLRDYLYIPLGGNHLGKKRRYFNLILTMLLGGLWHGAGWTFIVWGSLHGIYLLINHAWRGIKENRGWGNGGPLAHFFSVTLTFLAVVVGWVFFRADQVSSALTILQSMIGMNGISLPISFKNELGSIIGIHSWLVFYGLTSSTSLDVLNALGFLSIGFLIIWLMPNVHQIFNPYLLSYKNENENQNKLKAYLKIQWEPNFLWAKIIGILCAISLMNLNRVSEFLYFQF